LIFSSSKSQMTVKGSKINVKKIVPKLVPTWEVFPKTFMSFEPESQINERAIKLGETNAMVLS